MRKFDYQHLPKNLLEGDVADAHLRLFEDKGKLETLEQLHPEKLAALEPRALAGNVESSTSVEGLYLDAARIAELVDAGAQAKNELEGQIVGYANALRLIHEEGAQMELSTASILKLYETLFGYRDLGRKSRYRKKDYIYVQVDGHPQAMPVSPITAFETPLVLGGACDGLAEAVAADPGNSLVQSAVFTVDFLCIRPFDEGNGRISRLFALLMLEKAGFDVFHYQSIDRIIEEDAMAYYDALNACVEKWDRGMNDYLPYVRYWLGIVHEAYVRLLAKLEGERTMSKSQRIEACVASADGPITKRRLLETNPDVSEATVENVLGRLVREGAVEKIGAGRSTAYRALR